MKKIGAAILILALAVICLRLFTRKPTAHLIPVERMVMTDTSGATNAPMGSPVSPATTLISTTTDSQAFPVQAMSPATEVSSLPPATVLDNMRVLIHNYGAEFGENPVGNNAEITAALKGKNPRQINFIRDGAGLRVNDRGELVDAYGTPFFFHQLSGKVMEIRSAGEDRTLWTFDDLVTK